MLSSLCWVKGSDAKSVPAKHEPQAEEEPVFLEGLSLSEKQNITNAAAENKAEDPMDDEVSKVYNLDDYSDDEELPSFSGVGDHEESEDEEEEENEEENGKYLDAVDEDEESDIEDMVIKATDAIIVAAHSEEDISHLNFYIYEPEEDNMYVHHDVLLGAFPLCVEWIGYNANAEGNKGNLIAVGTYGTEIEIWDGDEIDSVQPLITLGQPLDPSQMVLTASVCSLINKKQKKKKKATANSHGGSVMGLSWNTEAKNILASCSADKTVKVWDLPKSTCLATLTHHKDKVQAVKWHRSDPKILLSGAFDKTVAILDARYPQIHNSCHVSADVECIEWNVHTPQQFMVSTEDGKVCCFDMRNLQQELWSILAHEKPVSGLSYNSLVPNFLATGSTDKYVKLWTIKNDQPLCVHTLQTPFSVFSLAFYAGIPSILAAGGKGESDVEGEIEDRLKVWNLAQIPEVAAAVSS